MKQDKYTHTDFLTGFGSSANALGSGGDRGQASSYSDDEDLSRGLCFIPGEVVVARRRGECVELVQRCHNPCCWYWQFPNGSCTYYWERPAYEKIAEQNGITLEKDKFGIGHGDAGACPQCGNQHTGGGHIEGLHSEEQREGQS